MLEISIPGSFLNRRFALAFDYESPGGQLADIAAFIGEPGLAPSQVPMVVEFVLTMKRLSPTTMLTTFASVPADLKGKSPSLYLTGWVSGEYRSVALVRNVRFVPEKVVVPPALRSGPHTRQVTFS